jgi:hypothetical protein
MVECAEEIASQELPELPAGDGQTPADHESQNGQTVVADTVRVDNAELPSQTAEPANSPGPAAIGVTVQFRDQEEDSQAELDL